MIRRLIDSPADRPAAERNRRGGKQLHDKHAHRGQDRHAQHVPQQPQRTLIGVGIAAAQRVERVGPFDAHGRPHQRPAHQCPDQQNRHQESEHQHKRPRKAGQHRKETQPHQPTQHHELQSKYGSPAQSQQRRQAIGRNLTEGMRQRTEHVGRFVAREFERGNPRDRAADQSPHQAAPKLRTIANKESQSPSARCGINRRTVAQ